MYVTFLYELDRRTWRGYQRGFDNYLARWDALFHSLKGQEVVAFGDDDRVQAIARKYPVTYIPYPLELWTSWSHLETTRKSIAAKYSDTVPERFSAEYVCLQLCKFDALRYATELFDAREWVWIDGGLRPEMIPKTWYTDWSENKIYVSLMSPSKPYRENSINIMGGCFGGDTASVRWVCDQINDSRKLLASQGRCGNDQELLTLIHSKHPKHFVNRKAYKKGPWGIYDTQWTYLCAAIGKEEPTDDTPIGLYLVVFFTCLACLKLRNVVRGV